MITIKQIALAGLVAFLVLYVPQAIAMDPPSYMPVDSGYTNFHAGYAEVFNSSLGISYGKAKIEWNYWYNSTNEYWYYAYKVCNNEGGNANDRTDDYHFGTVYNSGTAAGINGFQIDLSRVIQNTTGQELLVTSALAGSNSGGIAWDALIHESSENSDTFITGVNWSISTDNNKIKPTQWSWKRIGQNWKWVQDYAGDASRNDSGGQYFEFASKMTPGLVAAHISNNSVSSDSTLGSIYGPVPEPATCIILGLGFLGLSACRRELRR